MPLLKKVADKLPFPARVITDEILEEEAKAEKELQDKNINIFNFEYCLKNNMLGCRIWAWWLCGLVNIGDTR